MAERPPGEPGPHPAGGGGVAPAVAIVVSAYNATVTDALLEGALGELAGRWASARPAVLRSPGAFELVALSSAALRTGAFEAVVALGCVIRGETNHDKYINEAVAQGLARLAADSGLPVCFGVITAMSTPQARARAGLAPYPEPLYSVSGLWGVSDGQLPSGAKGNKGAEAMRAALDAIDELRRLRAAFVHNRPDMLAPGALPAASGLADKTAHEATAANGRGTADASNAQRGGS